jgi:hypothetical protein
MAKSAGKGSGGPSRIRLVVLEAELSDGDVNQITQAVTAALRGPAPMTVVKRIAASPSINGGVDQPESDVIDEEADKVTEDEAASQAPRPRVERKPVATPEPLSIDFNKFDPTLTAFAAEYRTEKHQQRYLVAAAWFQEHGGVTKVTPAHIYTAYRWLKWPLTVKDFGQPLRDMKSQGLFTSSEKGTYTLHHLGLQRVAELKTGSAG